MVLGDRLGSSMQLNRGCSTDFLKTLLNAVAGSRGKSLVDAIGAYATVEQSCTTNLHGKLHTAR